MTRAQVSGLFHVADYKDEQMMEALNNWLQVQPWQRDVDGPVLDLGDAGAFDERHMFAPCVAKEAGRYLMWYCGACDHVEGRVFRLGLATSEDGVRFEKHEKNPVLDFGDGLTSVLTPTLLRNDDGSVLRESGRMRMWFSAADLRDQQSPGHTIHETTSEDGVHWNKPSEALLKWAYSPSVLKEGTGYVMWYADWSDGTMSMRCARSKDGRQWQVHPEPVLVADQAWEKQMGNYPMVVRSGNGYVMWYGAFWVGDEPRTAIGCAVSEDGIHWRKHTGNPVFRPEPSRWWESHYTTSGTVLKLGDGRYRMWYASRSQPPFVNKYRAIGTAVLAMDG